MSVALFHCVGDVAAAPDDGGVDAGVDVDLTGTEGHACFPNHSCDGTLSCVSNVCVSLMSDDGGADATADASDASLVDGPGDAPHETSCKTPVSPTSTVAGPVCPFMAGDAGNNSFGECGTGEHCCAYKLSLNKASTCNAANVACSPSGYDAGNLDFQCNETNDCAQGKICCLTPPSYLNQDPGCTSYYFASSPAGTTCETSCAGQPQICGLNGECPVGHTCMPLNTFGVWIGVCVGADGGL